MNLLQTARNAWKTINLKKWPTDFEVLVYSEVLGEDVVWAADDTKVRNPHNRVVYRESLVRKIIRSKLAPAAMANLHELLKVFPEDHFQVTEIFSTTVSPKLKEPYESAV